MLFIGILIIILVIGLMPEKLSWSFFNRKASLIMFFSAILSFNSCNFENLNSGLGLYNGLWQITSMNTSISTFIYIIAGLALLLGEGSPRKGGQNLVKPEYSLIIMLSTMGMISLIHSYDLITFFLAIELQSLSLYVLATIYKESESATSAGLKYFLLGGLSSSFILLGSSLLYGLTGMTNFESFYIINSFESSSFSIIGPALLILLVGLLFKLAAAPFHNWAPDVYDGVPTLVTSWLAVLPKISIIIIMIEIFSNIFYQFYSPLSGILIFSSFLSLLIGSILGLAQYRIKRLLAYSTISHVGFILLALGTNTYQSIESLIFYIIQYSLASLTIFYIIIAFGYILPNSFSYSWPILTFSHLKGKLKNNTLLAWSFAICLFSMAGIPPCIGFFGKFLILLSSINAQNLNFMILVAIITSVMSTVYYLKVIKVIHFDKSDTESISPLTVDTFSISQNIVFSNALVISILSLVIMLFILNPTPIINLIHIISLSQIIL